MNDKYPNYDEFITLTNLLDYLRANAHRGCTFTPAQTEAFIRWFDTRNTTAMEGWRVVGEVRAENAALRARVGRLSAGLELVKKWRFIINYGLKTGVDVEAHLSMDEFGVISNALKALEAAEGGAGD